MYSLSDNIKLCRALNDAQIMHLMQILGKGCRRKTKELLERRLTFAHIQRNHGIYERVMVYPEVRYVPGQCYTTEVATIRKLLIG